MPFCVKTAGGPHSVSAESNFPLRGSITRSKSPFASQTGLQLTRSSEVARFTNSSPQYIRYLPPIFAATSESPLRSQTTDADFVARSRKRPENAGPCFVHFKRSRDVATPIRGTFLFHIV